MELLSKEAGLMRDRQILSREVEFLRQQLTTNNVDLNRFYSSHTVVVNDIISNVKWEQEERGRGRPGFSGGSGEEGGDLGDDGVAGVGRERPGREVGLDEEDSLSGLE